MDDEELEITHEEGSIGSDIAKAMDEVDSRPPEDAPLNETIEEAPGEVVEEAPESLPEAAEIKEAPIEDTFDAAPNSLSPLAREKWKETPLEIRKEMARREQNYEQGIMKYAEDAKRAKAVDAMVQPYQQYLAMAGQPPADTIGQLLQTASVLQMGTPVQRAQQIAQIINQFGVDIETLDHILSGSGAPPPAPEQYITQAVQQAIQPYQQFMSQFEQQQQIASQQKMVQLQSELGQFEQTHEFYKDVRADMADILDLAAARNMDMPLEEVYRRACLMHPEVSQILEARGRQPTPRQRAAATSLRGAPGGVEVDAEPEDLRAAIAKAWDMTQRR